MEKRCKVLFETEYEEGEIIKETLWAIDLGNSQYCIDNIPFYAYSVALGDIFSAYLKDDFLYTQDLIEESGNSTIRILFEEVATVQSTRDNLLAQFGCISEVSNLNNLVAINIPYDKNYGIIKDFLQRGEELGKWQYQEGCLSFKHKEEA